MVRCDTICNWQVTGSSVTVNHLHRTTLNPMFRGDETPPMCFQPQSFVFTLKAVSWSNRGPVFVEVLFKRVLKTAYSTSTSSSRCFGTWLLPIAYVMLIRIILDLCRIVLFPSNFSALVAVHKSLRAKWLNTTFLSTVPLKSFLAQGLWQTKMTNHI